MDWRKFKFNDNRFVILKEKRVYSAMPCGRFRKLPDSFEYEVVEPKHYENFVTSVPFFNNWGNGAYCRCAVNQTRAGKIPTTITTVSPYRTEKHVVLFRFISKYDLEKSAGWREKEVLKNARSYKSEVYQNKNGYFDERLTFITDDTGVTASATYDFGSAGWVD